MAIASTDKLRKWSRRWVGQIGSGGVSSSAVQTIPLSSTTSLPTDTAITLVIGRVDSAGALTPSLEETIVGIVSGSNIVTATRGVEGTAQVHSAGAVVELLSTATEHNDLIDALLNITTSAGILDITKVVDLTTAQTLTNKTLTSPVINTPTGDVATKTGTETLTNKTLTSPVINTPTGDVATKTGTETLTNKRTNPRVVTATSYTTDTGISLSVATADEFDVTAQAGALKLNNPGGTPVNGQKLIVRIKDNATARALTYDTQFRASTDLALPTTTVLSKTLYMGFLYNSADTKWDLLASLNNF